MLPGKLCIGILEEDNPLKSYFRLKPLLVENEGRYEAFDGGEIYPEEGCIRIVPDKNESSHFKARMRRMGKYCVLDLREHTGENDKIRPNKNYHGDETERNAHIVYSDVVREPAPDMIFEIADFDGEGDWQNPAPGTARILRGEGLETWKYTPAEEENLPAHIAPDGEKLTEEEMQRFEIPGFPGETLRLAVRLPGVMPSVIGVPAPKAEKIHAPVQEPAQEKSAPAEPKAEVVPEKPWISHDLPQLQPVHGRMTPMEQAMAAQTGLNPRRNRSLQEIIEEKWRHSRVDQLGHPVPANAMGKPVEDPVERAVAAVRSAWDNPEIHSQLLNALAGMGEFSSALDARKRSAGEAALRRELEDLEAERLKSLDALDKLRREKQTLRETFKQEIRQEEAAALKEAVERTKAAQAECKKYESAAEEARKAAEFAKDAFEALNDGRFEERLRDFALNSRAAEILAHPLAKEETVSKQNLVNPDREEWIQRVMQSFAADGLDMDEVQAANLLVCAALGNSLIFSGAAASDKWIAAKAFARALGGCTVEVQVEPADNLAADGDMPTVALVRDANNVPYIDICRGICAEGNLLVISTVADAGTGFPLSAEALERGFLVRMEPVSENAPWQPKKPVDPRFPAASMASLRNAFLGHEAELPVALDRRLQKIRSVLAVHGVRLSRRTLDCMWHYCAAMLSLNRISPADALDRAFAQKALPCILAEAPVTCLAELKSLLAEMPRSQALLNAPLPILI